MASKSLPHIILLLLDTASAKRFSLYGHHRDTTPRLGQLAAEAMLYRHCFAPAQWTIPSHISLFTGLYPGEHGCKGGGLPPDFLVLPEVLQEMGYHTAAISSNLIVSRSHGFDRGFDEFHEMENLVNSGKFIQAADAFKEFKTAHKGEWARFAFLARYAFNNNYYLYPVHSLFNKIYRKYYPNVVESSSRATERSFKIARRILKRNRDTKPVFMFINLMEPHWKYNPPPQYNNIIKLDPRQREEILKLEWYEYYHENGFSPEQIETLDLLYDQELAYLDQMIWDFHRFLQDRGFLDQTLLIITADHGECLGEHGLWGHGFSLYNELIHIPLMVKYPAPYDFRGESRQVVQLHDLFATLAELAGAPYPVPDSSRSLLGPPRDFALAESYRWPEDVYIFKRKRIDLTPTPVMQPCRALIDRDLNKLILYADGRQELYDLKVDYNEQHNRLGDPKYQEVARSLSRRLESLGFWDIGAPGAAAGGKADHLS